MAHAYKPDEFVAKKQAKQDYEANKLATPSPNSVPQLLARMKLLEQLLGV